MRLKAVRIKISKRKDLTLTLEEKCGILAKYDDLPKCSQNEEASKLGTFLFFIKFAKNRDSINAQIVANGNLNHKWK